jgi:hypothetical protein
MPRLIPVRIIHIQGYKTIIQPNCLFFLNKNCPRPSKLVALVLYAKQMTDGGAAIVTNMAVVRSTLRYFVSVFVIVYDGVP